MTRHTTLTEPAVNTASTPAPRRRDVVENDEYAAFTRRVLRAHARRIATGDVESLGDLVALATELDEAISAAVKGLRAFGYSWAEIANRLHPPSRATALGR